MSEFKFSIITVVNNSLDAFKKTIYSIINQSIGFKDNVEIIIVNDNSDKIDETIKEFSDKYPRNIKLINNKDRLGCHSSRNIAINEAKGEIISFLDSGDYFSSKTLKSIFKTFNSNLNLDIVAVPTIIVSDKKEEDFLNYKFRELFDLHFDNSNNVILSDKEYNLNIYDEELDDVLFSQDSVNLRLFHDLNTKDDSNFSDTISLDDKIILLDETYNLKLYEEDNEELVLTGGKINTVNDVSIINLNEFPQAIQLSASSAFFRKESINGIQFCKENFNADAVFVNEILLKKPIIALNSEGIFYKEKNLDLDISLRTNKEFYISRFNDFYFKLIEKSLEYYGHVLEFIQYVIAYDLQFLFKIDFIDSILNKEEFKDFYLNLIEILAYIHDDVILNQRYISQSLKAHILFLKHFKFDYLSDKCIKLDNFDDLDNNLFAHLVNSKFELSYKQMNLFKRLVKEDPLLIDVYKINESLDNDCGELFISGVYTSFFDLDLDILIDIENSYETIICDKFNNSQRDFYSLNCPYGYNHYFEVKIPIDKNISNSNMFISFKIIISDIENSFSEYDNGQFFDVEIDFNKFSNFSKISKYQLSNRYISEIVDNEYIEISKKSKFKLFLLEIKTLFRLISKNEKNWGKYILIRFVYWVFKFLNSKQIWIFLDNDSHIFGNTFELCENIFSINDDIKKYFVLDKNDSKFKEIKKRVKIIKKNSLKHKIISLFADKIIVSDFSYENIYPWNNYEFISGLLKSKIILLSNKKIRNNLYKNKDLYFVNIEYKDLNLTNKNKDSELIKNKNDKFKRIYEDISKF